MTTRSSAERQQLWKEHTHKAKRALALATLGFLVPFGFMTPIYGLIAGVGLGAYSVYHLRKSRSIPQITEPDKEFIVDPPRDTEITPQMLIGYGMDFEEFKTNQDEWLQAQGKTRMDTNLLRQYMGTALRSMYPLYMNDDLATRHVAVIGATGVGKTELIMSALQANIARGGGALILNAKGDRKFRNNVNYLANLYNRGDDVRIVDFENTAISHKYNPVLNGGNVRTRVSTLMKLNPKGKEEFFRDQNRSALVAGMACLAAQPDRPAFHLGDLGVLFNDPYEFHRLFQNIPEQEAEVKDFVWQFLKKWVRIDKEGTPYYGDKFAEILNGLATKMFDFAHSEYRELLCTYEPDIDIKKAILENQIVIISVPALSDKEAVNLFGKLVFADVSRAIGELQNEGLKPLVPFQIHMEEYGSFKDETHQELFQLARSANVSLWLSIQGLGFLSDPNAPDFGDNILSNCWTQFYLYSLSSLTYEHAQMLAGTVIRQFRQDSDSQVQGDSFLNANTGQFRTENQSRSRSRGYKETREELLQPEDFRRMDKGDAILISRQDVFRVRLPIVEFKQTPPEVEKITLPYFERPKAHGLNLLEKARQRDASLIQRLGQR